MHIDELQKSDIIIIINNNIIMPDGGARGSEIEGIEKA